MLLIWLIENVPHALPMYSFDGVNADLANILYLAHFFSQLRLHD
jgi:hypothetical protein